MINTIEYFITKSQVINDLNYINHSVKYMLTFSHMGEKYSEIAELHTILDTHSMSAVYCSLRVAVCVI